MASKEKRIVRKQYFVLPALTAFVFLIAMGFQNCGPMADSGGGSSATQGGTLSTGEEGNTAPSDVAVTAPVNGSQFIIGQTLDVTATASDVDGDPVSVEFFIDGNSFGVDNNANYTAQLSTTALAAGGHEITVIATDDRGGATQSNGATFNLAAPAVDDPDLCLVANGYQPPALNSVPANQSGSFGMGDLAGTSFPNNVADIQFNGGSQAVVVDISCSSDDDNIDVNCNDNGTVNIAPDANQECVSGTATITVELEDAACQPNVVLGSMNFQVNYTDTCKVERYLKAGDVKRNGLFGSQSSLSATHLVVTAPGNTEGGLTLAGAGYVYLNNGGNWSQQAKLVPSRIVGMDNTLGAAINTAGSIVALGSSNFFDSGSNQLRGLVTVFTRSGTAWSETRALVGPANASAFSSEFGYAVQVGPNNQVIVGAPGNDGAQGNGGAVFVYSSAGALVQTIRPADTFLYQEFGRSVSVDGNWMVVGAPTQADQEGNIAQSGAAYVYQFNGATWVQRARVAIVKENTNIQYGFNVGVDGGNPQRIIVGAKVARSGNLVEGGRAYVYRNNAGNWQQEGGVLLSPDAATRDRFGSSVKIDGGIAVVGAPEDDDKTGSVYMYTLNGGNWVHSFKVRKRGNKQPSVFTGDFIDLLGRKLLMGSPADNSDGNGGGSDNSGAVYVIDL